MMTPADLDHMLMASADELLDNLDVAVRALAGRGSFAELSRMENSGREPDAAEAILTSSRVIAELLRDRADQLEAHAAKWVEATTKNAA